MTSGAQGSINASGFPIGLVQVVWCLEYLEVRKMSGMPGMENDNWEVPKSRSMPSGNGSTVQPAGCIPPPLIGKSPAPNQQCYLEVSGSFTSGRTSSLSMLVVHLLLAQLTVEFYTNPASQLSASLRQASVFQYHLLLWLLTNHWLQLQDWHINLA